MQQVLSYRDVEPMLEPRIGPCVSMCLPTHRTGRDIQQDRSRLKNALRTAQRELEELGHDAATVHAVLDDARDLLDDDLFWLHQDEGLEVFAARDYFRPLRLPVELRELVVVADALHVKPLLPLLLDARFLVLALSRNRVRVLDCTRWTVRELEPDGVPRSLGDFLGTFDFEKSLQFHSSARADRSQVIFHGQGTPEEEQKARLAEFFRKVDAGMGEYLGGKPRPVVFAGVEYYLPIFREVASHTQVLDTAIAGNPDKLPASELHNKAWKLVEPLFGRERDQAADRYGQLAGTGKTSERVLETVRAAAAARVDTLFVASDLEVWGRPPADANGDGERHEKRLPGDSDLLNFAAILSLRTGAKVFVEPSERLPSGTPIAAILRY